MSLDHRLVPVNEERLSGADPVPDTVKLPGEARRDKGRVLDEDRFLVPKAGRCP